MNFNDYVPTKIKKPKQTPSVFQQAGLDWVANNRGKFKAAVMNAVAGSGKSWELREIYKQESSKYNRMLLVCFGRDPAEEAKRKNAEDTNVRNIDIKTYHSLGFSGIRKLYKGVKLENFSGEKTEMIVKPSLSSNHKFLLGPIKKLTSLCKANAIAYPDYDIMQDIALTYDIDFGDETPQELVFKAYELAMLAVNRSHEYVETLIDFDDMIFLPVTMGIVPDQYDLILADEFQDTNVAQSKLIQMSRSGIVIGVGDPYQSIYAFRGADSRAMQKLITEFEADQLPLSICYRCPQTVGDLVRKEFPHIDFQTPEWAIPGTVNDMDIKKSLDIMQDGDLVVSRVNKSLPPIAFGLIRQGKTARIMGRDIGKSLETLIKKQNCDGTLEDLFSKIHDYREKEMSKFARANRPDKIQQLDDKIETLDALSEGAKNVWDLITLCNTMFSDEKSGIMLGTVHKNKGNEANNVFIAAPELLPLPFVMSKGNPEAKQQEMNCVYVSYTRAKNSLTFLRGEL